MNGDAGDLRTPEWRVLCAPADAPEQPDFKLRTVGPPPALAGVLEDVVLVERLREVSALRGFTRINAPDELGSGGGKIVPLVARAAALAAVQRGPRRGDLHPLLRGDGARVGGALPGVRRRRHVLRAATPRVARAPRASTADEGWPGDRYVLLHSFAHALIRELALECGYTASSIRERIYAISRGDEGEPMAGVLLYTAAPDSEGTLGGLVSLGEPDQLGPLLRQALERAQLCSSDPLCSEHDPGTDASVHAAACHACQFASETSCERGNRFLDRATLVRDARDRTRRVAYFPPA